MIDSIMGEKVLIQYIQSNYIISVLEDSVKTIMKYGGQ